MFSSLFILGFVKNTIVIINKNINDIVEVGDTIMTLYTNKEVPNIDINKLFIISNNKNDDNKLIYEVIE